MKKSYPIAKPKTPLEVKLDENVYVSMRDGIKLAVDIYRPEAEGCYPVILSMSPYMKEMQQHPPHLSHSIEAGATDFFVPKGYIHVIAQIRGSGMSQGRYNFFDIKEQQDGYDLVEWIAQQPWCNGNVGMLGDSYFAMIQYLVAAQKPPHLRCIVPFDGMTDLYRNMCYQGGLFRSGFLSRWGLDLLCQCVWPGPLEGKLQPANFFIHVLSRPNDGPYYWKRSAWTKIHKIEVPTLNMVVQQGSQHIRGHLRSYPEIKAPKKLLVVPPARDGHIFFLHNRPLNEQILRWLDYWLKDINTGIMEEPPVAIFDTGTRQWRYEKEYPLSRTEWTKFYLRSNFSTPATKPPSGLISLDPPESEEPDRYRTPESTNQILAGKPVLLYTTLPLKEDVRIWGPLSAVLYGSSTTNMDTVWFVKIEDVAPDGKVTFVTQGHLKASYRAVDEARSKPGQPFHPYRHAALPEPNQVYKYQIEMTPIFHTFKAGHKISIHIASDDPSYHSFPRTTYAYEILTDLAENAIHHDSKNPSHLVLPIIPDAQIIKPVDPPVSQITWPLDKMS